MRNKLKTLDEGIFLPQILLLGKSQNLLELRRPEFEALAQISSGTLAKPPGKQAGAMPAELCRTVPRKAGHQVQGIKACS